MRTPVIGLDNDACGAQATPPKTLWQQLCPAALSQAFKASEGRAGKLSLIFKSNSSTLWHAIFK